MNEDVFAVWIMIVATIVSLLIIAGGVYHQEQERKRQRDRAEIRDLQRELEKQQRRMHQG